MSAEPDEYTAEPEGEVQDGAGGDGADVNNQQAVCACCDPSHAVGPTGHPRTRHHVTQSLTCLHSLHGMFPSPPPSFFLAGVLSQSHSCARYWDTKTGLLAPRSLKS